MTNSHHQQTRQTNISPGRPDTGRTYFFRSK
jgi:hypothetical protein